MSFDINAYTGELVRCPVCNAEVARAGYCDECEPRPCARFTAPGRRLTSQYTECFACGFPKRDHRKEKK